jgi:hypothetical protein
MTTAPTCPDWPRQRDDYDQRQHDHPLDAAVPDPSGLTPLCDEPQFAAILDSMVADEAPWLFAVVQEYGERGRRLDRGVGHGVRRSRRGRLGRT